MTLSGRGGFGRGSDPDDFAGFLPAEPRLTPIPPRREHPPKVWGAMTVEGEQLVVSVSGWRSIWAIRRRIVVPLSCVVRVAHDPAARANIRTKLRTRAGRSGIIRLGTYHSLDGWSFWAVGLARNAVVVELSGARFRFVVVEVADPAGTVEAIRSAAGLEDLPEAPE